MAQRSKLPGVTSRILDYGLGVGPEPRDLNDSILVIGTASDGPMYEPVPLPGGKDQTQLIFGSFGDGSLARGIFEALDATITGTPDIRAMRIGDGLTAYLDIAERLSTSNAWDAKTTGFNSIRLKAIYPGSKYNAISIFLDEEKKINIFNPKTGITSKFTYDDTNPNNSSVDARDVRELVDAINADANLSSVLVASASGIQTQFEIEVNSASTGVTVTNGKAELDLRSILSGYGVPSSTDVVPTGYIFEADTSATAGNLLDILDEVFSISVSTPVELETKGTTSVKLALTPFDGKGDTRIDTIQALEDYGSDNTWQYNPSSGAVVSEYMNYLNKEAFTDVTVSGSAASFAHTLEVTGWNTPPDDSQEPFVSGVVQSVTIDSTITAATDWVSGNIAMAWASGNASEFTVANGYLTNGITPDSMLSDYVNITASGVVDSDGVDVFTYPGQIKIEVANTSDPLSDQWADAWYHPSSGIYISNFAVSSGVGTLTLGIGAEASGVSATTPGSLVGIGLIDSGALVQPDMFLRISCNTIKDFLSEVETLPALSAASDNWRSYFVRGSDLLFADTVPFNVVANYGTKVDYEPGSDITITDSYYGKIKFNGTIQPGPGGAELSATSKSIIGLKYKHLPQFPAITTAAQSLDNGTDGTGISTKKLYEELDTAYDTLQNYNVNIVVPMGAYIDATKDGFNAVTGLPETVNAQFQNQFHEFLDNVSINVNETIGVMGVQPSQFSNLSAVKNWVDRLTIQNFNDPTRGANIIPLLSSKYISIAAFEPIFDNVGGLPYTANGQSAYAGMISSLVPHQAPTNKSIPNARRMRFDLSNGQLELLGGTRLVAMRNKPGRNPVIADAITTAPFGSDFVRMTTIRITFAAMDVVRQVCDPFIGQPNDKGRRNAMEAAITKGLSSMVEAGALREYNFTITSTPQQQVNGIIEIELILVPVFEIRRIRATVKLRTELPTG